MKKYILFVVLFIIIVFMVVIIMFNFNKKNIKIDSIKEIEYSISDGRSMFGSIKYNLKCDDNCILYSKLDGYLDDELFEVEISKEDVESILKILNDNKAGSWDGFNKSNKNVLDGDSYTFSVVSLDNQKIYVSGYMAYPKNFREAIKEIISIFDNANESMFFDLLSHDNYKDFVLDDIVKVVEEFHSEGGIESNSYTDKEKIEGIYNRYKNIKLGIETKRGCDDNTRVYKFIMKSGREYIIEEECGLIVLDGRRYVPFYK